MALTIALHCILFPDCEWVHPGDLRFTDSFLRYTGCTLRNGRLSGPYVFGHPFLLFTTTQMFPHRMLRHRLFCNLFANKKFAIDEFAINGCGCPVPMP